MKKAMALWVGLFLVLSATTLAKKGGKPGGSEGARYVRADLPNLGDPYNLFSDTGTDLLTCTDGVGSYDYAHRDDECMPQPPDFGLLFVRSDSSAGERWMFGVGHDFQTPGDPSDERRLGVDFGDPVGGHDGYHSVTNTEGESLYDRLSGCNGCEYYGGEAWGTFGHWTMDKVFMEGVERHELTVNLQQIGDNGYAGITHFEYVNPLYVCPDPVGGEDFRIVQTWGPCGCVGSACTDDVSEVVVRIGNPGVKKKSDRTTEVGRYSMPTWMRIQKAGSILP